MLVSCSENHLHLLSRVDDFEFSLFFHKLLFLWCKDNLLFPYSETISIYFIQPVVSFWRVFFVCGIGSFFVPRSDFSPSPLYELSPYRRGGCSSIARQSKRTARGNRALPCFSSCPTGLRLNISRLSFLTAISLKLWLKSYLCKSEI